MRTILKDTIIQSGADPGLFLLWAGRGGGPNFGSERTVEIFCCKFLLPNTDSHQSQFHVIIPWALNVYVNSTRKGCILGISFSCTINVDQLRKQRRPRFSQFVNTGLHWREIYCFASRGEQIIRGYRKTITLLNIPGI